MIDDLKAIVGNAYVLTGKDMAPWCEDWTGSYRSTPMAVVKPATTAEVSDIVKWANKTGTPVVPVSGNTGIVGGTQNNGAVMVSVDRLNQITNINPAARTATVGAGVILSHLHDAVDEYDLIFPLTFGARGSAMIGGVMSTNAGGSNVLRYGNTRDLVLGLEAVLPNGDVLNLMSALHKDNSGFNLKHLLIGAEGCLGIITAAVVKLFPKPAAYATAMVATPDVGGALSLLNRLQEATGGGVEAFELMPRHYIEAHLDRIDGAREPFDQPYDVNIMVEVGATSQCDARANDDGTLPVVEHLQHTLEILMQQGAVLDAVVAQNEAQRRIMWDRREAAAEITFWRHPHIDTDVAVPLDQVDTFLKRANDGINRLDKGSSDFCVSHLGDGNIHYMIYPTSDDPDLKDRLIETVEDIVQDLGGSFSAEHGIGLSKRNTMARRKDAVALAMMKTIKTALDTNNIMNPDKVIPD